MIPSLRSLSELMAITESRNRQNDLSENIEKRSSTMDSGQRKRYTRSMNKNEVKLPELHKKIRHKWIKNKEDIRKFIYELDYNNQIQSSYDLTLLGRQNKRNEQDAA